MDICRSRSRKFQGSSTPYGPFVTWFTENIFREDKEIVEYEQRAYDAQGTDWNNEVFPPLRDLRGVLARCGRPMK